MSEIIQNFSMGDEDGIDPFLEPNLNNALSITKYTVMEISAAEAGRPELISYHVYGTVDFWKEILAFNGISDVRHMRAGTSIRVPDRAQMLDALSNIDTAPRGREVSL